MKKKYRKIALILVGILLFSLFATAMLVSAGMYVSLQNEISENKENIEYRIESSHDKLEKVVESMDLYVEDEEWIHLRRHQYKDDIMRTSTSLDQGISVIENIYGEKARDKVEKASRKAKKGIETKDLQEIRESYDLIEEVKRKISKDEG